MALVGAQPLWEGGSGAASAQLEARGATSFKEPQRLWGLTGLQSGHACPSVGCRERGQAMPLHTHFAGLETLAVPA